MNASSEKARPIPVVRSLRGCITAPPSKSVTQRALVAASLAPGVSFLKCPLLAGDASRLMSGLEAVGIPIVERGGGPDGLVEVDGTRGALPAGCPTLDLGNAGTAMRFLAARLALPPAPCVLDGDARMRRRPIEDLLSALRALGGAAASVHGDGCPPVRVGGPGMRGGRARLAGSRSSQYLSALLLAAPGMPDGVEIELDGGLVSRPYVDLTLDVMRRFGVVADPTPPSGNATRFRVAPGQAYRPTAITIEGDYSSASCFFAAAAIIPGRVEVRGLEENSLQGDARFLDLLSDMGCHVERARGAVTLEGPGTLRGLDCDLAGMPDIAPALAVVALFAAGDSRIRGVPHLRIKESDRIAVLCEAIARLQGDASPTADGLIIRPRRLQGALIDPHADHRMAMAFAIAGLRLPGTSVADPGCVDKSYPGFWSDLDRLTRAG